MPIVVNLDVVLAQRKMKLKELSEATGLTVDTRRRDLDGE